MKKKLFRCQKVKYRCGTTNLLRAVTIPQCYKCTVPPDKVSSKKKKKTAKFASWWDASYSPLGCTGGSSGGDAPQARSPAAAASRRNGRRRSRLGPSRGPDVSQSNKVLLSFPGVPLLIEVDARRAAVFPALPRKTNFARIVHRSAVRARRRNARGCPLRPGCRARSTPRSSPMQAALCRAAPARVTWPC